MNSNKSFSMSKLYSDLEKYESNLQSSKNSRVRKTTQGFAAQKSSGARKINIAEHIQFGNSNQHMNRCSQFDRNGEANQKSKIQVKTVKMRQQRRTFEEIFDRNSFQTDPVHNQQSHLVQKSSKQSEIDYSKCTSMYSKNDETNFLRQCNNLYNCNASKQNESKSIKILLKQINKRDEVYQIASNNLGDDNVAHKLSKFFERYETMKGIISEFKKMSKVTIDDDKQLLNFLQSDRISETDQ